MARKSSNVVELNDPSRAVKPEELHMTDAVKYLHETRELNYNRKEIPVRDKAYREAFAENPYDIEAVRFAKGFKRFLQTKSILINEYDILAGFAYRYTYKTTMPVTMPDDYDPKYRPLMALDGDREMRTTLDFHKISRDSDEGREFAIFEAGIDAWFYKHWESGHILPGYDRVLEIGFTGLVELGKKCFEHATGTQREFIRAMLITNEAAVEYVGRYAKKAAKMAKEATDPGNKERLTRMAKACKALTERAPETFYEAVQCLWFAHEMMLAENIPASESLGRMDVYLYPFYKKELDAGTITYDQAHEILDALWIKFSGNLHAYQAITLGGVDDEGNPVANDITYMCMQSTRKLRYDQPLLCLRYVDNMPERLWNETLELIKTGTGFPGIFYDPTCIKARLRAGIAPEDAHKYAIVGCVEMGIPGHEYTPTEFARLNWPKLFELMFNGGHDTMSNYYYPLHENKDLDSIKSFYEFYEWFKSEMVEAIELAIRCIQKIDTMLPYNFPTPYLSSLMVGCYENGKDVTGGGTQYNNTGVSTCGLATTADSLAAIKKVVFEEKKMKLSEFAKAVNANFEGYEELHDEVLNHCPKFGNDNDEVDYMLADLIDTFSKTVESHRNPRGGHFMTGLYSVEDHAKMGAMTAATPDGRLKGTAHSNSLASVQGKDINGPTALVNSAVKTEIGVATNGMVLDLKFNPKFFEKKSHEQALRALIKSYFDRGGMEIQFSVVSRETLIAAQKDPQKYKDLVVRVSGFSAYFNSLAKTTQDEIILRTEYQSL